MQIDTWIKKEQESLIALRRWFHMHPEPSMKEYETAAKIEEELTRIGVAHRRIRETGVFASIKEVERFLFCVRVWTLCPWRICWTKAIAV